MEIQARKKSRVMDELVAMGLKGLSCYNEVPRFSISLSILKKGQVLVKEGGRFNGVYIVRSGFLKNVYFDVLSSEDKVLGFFFSGDFVGLDSVIKKQYRSTVIALETVGVIKLSFSGLEDFPGDVYDRLEFLCFSNTRIQSENDCFRNFFNKKAEARLASFFIDLSCRFEVQGYSPYCFRLPMKHQEIASYLNMTLETLSRIISRFKLEGAMSVKGHEYVILEMDYLKSLMNRSGKRGLS
ncbi:Crp/Fnr family transcriptional regulator [Chromohalobacter israelensis]|uniref:Crp/Fnr family transcriptional regulator n=1 Tax=Chromohalobacter israelensis TaxID=141390 RepID=UPI00265BF0CE|nr:helix-turn-helix domain-containing protein [Chromohalobacter salexigens]MDO0944857.1 helix-turn-helix domain-containing protein [Chromohalobacter salexigens]